MSDSIEPFVVPADEYARLIDAVAERDKAFAAAVDATAHAKRLMRERDEARAEVERLREDVTAYRNAIHTSLMGMEQLTDDELGPGGGARRAFAGLWHAYHAIPAGIPTPPSSEALAPADTGEQS